MKNKILVSVLFAIIMLSSSVAAGTLSKLTTDVGDIWYWNPDARNASDTVVATCWGAEPCFVTFPRDGSTQDFVNFTDEIKHAQIAPDGTIYYIGMAIDASNEIFKYKAGVHTRLTAMDYAVEYFKLCPGSWDTLAFYTGAPNFKAVIHKIETDGTDHVQLTSGQVDGRGPTGSGSMDCDGTNVLFIREDSDNGWFVAAVPLVGGAVTALTDASWTESSNPQFSTDFSKVTYSYNYNIWTMNSDGSNKNQETAGNNWYNSYYCPDNSLYALEKDGAPYYLTRISPDSAQIAQSQNNGYFHSCSANPAGGYDIYFADTDYQMWRYNEESEDPDPPTCDAFTDCGLGSSITASSFTVNDATMVYKTEPVVSKVSGTSICSSNCVTVTNISSTDTCENTNTDACSSGISMIQNVLIGNKPNLSVGDALVTQKNGNSYSVIAGFDFNTNKLYTGASNINGLAWANGYVSNVANVEITGEPIIIQGVNGNLIIAAPGYDSAQNQTVIFFIEINADTGDSNGEYIFRYTVSTSIKLSDADSTVDGCVLAVTLEDNGTELGGFLHIPLSNGIGTPSLFKITPSTGTSVCVAAAANSYPYPARAAVFCNLIAGAAGQASIAYFNLPQNGASISAGDIQTKTFVVNDAGDKKTIVEDISYTPSSPNFFLAFRYAPGFGVIASFNPATETLLAKKVNTDVYVLTAVLSKQPNNMGLFGVGNIILGLGSLSNSALFTFDTQLKPKESYTFSDYDTVAGVTPGFAAIKDSNGSSALFSFFSASTTLTTLPDYMTPFTAPRIFSANWNGGIFGDHFVVELPAEYVSGVNYSLNLPLFNISGTGYAINPNGTTRFSTDMQVAIATYNPDINILNFRLDWQCFNGSFDSTNGTCDCCSFDGSDDPLAGGNGWCQAEIEKVWGMFESYNLTISLDASTPDGLPINFTSLHLVCRSFADAIVINSNCSGLSNWTDTSGACFVASVPAAYAAYASVIGNAVYIDLTSLNMNLTNMPFGTISPDSTCEQIACEVEGTWEPGNTLEFTVNKTITVTAI